MKIRWEKIRPIFDTGIKLAGMAVAGTAIVVVNRLLRSPDDFENWLKTASDEELEDGYEERRLEWLKNSHGDRTPEMRRIDDEMVRRMNETYRREHPDAQPRHREHGWYLPNDD